MRQLDGLGAFVYDLPISTCQLKLNPGWPLAQKFELGLTKRHMVIWVLIGSSVVEMSATSQAR